MRNGADGRHQAERDRQVEMAALLRQVGRRQIDRDAPAGQGQAGGDQRRTHPLLGLVHRLVRQADNVEHDIAGQDMHLHVHRRPTHDQKKEVTSQVPLCPPVRKYLKAQFLVQFFAHSFCVPSVKPYFLAKRISKRAPTRSARSAKSPTQSII